jgi:hypothetical protein
MSAILAWTSVDHSGRPDIAMLVLCVEYAPWVHRSFLGICLLRNWGLEGQKLWPINLRVHTLALFGVQIEELPLVL